MITISFYSYKGGVGRSLTLANLGVYLAQFGAKVAMVDFDLEAPGLHYKLSPSGPVEIGNRGLVGLLADVSRGVKMADIDWNLGLDVSEHAEVVQTADDDIDQPSGGLFLIPAGNPMQSEYWHDLAAIDWDRLFMVGSRPGVAALAHLKKEIEKVHDPDVLLVDSRTGITPGGGVSTTLLPNVVVTMMLNTPEHLDGSRLVVSAVIGSERASGENPEVVPVLSRYMNPDVEDRSPGVAARYRVARGQLRIQPRELQEEIPLEELRETLISDLSADAAERIHTPLVLHADLDLQHHEYLTFGPYAQSGSELMGQTLLEDYLRLFAALVPREMFLRYLTGVRERARSILLDKPEDAVRTLESLATLVGDEDAFVDLVKVYVLRREWRNLLVAAERLHRVHNRIVPHPALSKELRGLLAGRPRQRVNVDMLSVLSEAFAERYWREVALDDVEWGAAVARFLADREHPAKAKALAEELIEREGDPKTTARILRIVSFGGSDAETIAVQTALAYFPTGAESLPFLEAAAAAARYRESDELAGRILEASAGSSLPTETLVHLSMIAGKIEEAGALLVEELATQEELSDELAELWTKLARRLPNLRRELRERNPELLDQLDSMEPEEPL
jgi:hypothetical protein